MCKCVPMHSANDFFFALFVELYIYVNNGNRILLLTALEQNFIYESFFIHASSHVWYNAYLFADPTMPTHIHRLSTPYKNYNFAKAPFSH